MSSNRIAHFTAARGEASPAHGRVHRSARSHRARRRSRPSHRSSGAAQAPVGLGSRDQLRRARRRRASRTPARRRSTATSASFPTPTETGFGTVTLERRQPPGDAVTAAGQERPHDRVQHGRRRDAVHRARRSSSAGRTLTARRLPIRHVRHHRHADARHAGRPERGVHLPGRRRRSSPRRTATSSCSAARTACNVFWQVGSSATLGTGSHLIGSVLALQARSPRTPARPSTVACSHGTRRSRSTTTRSRARVRRAPATTPTTQAPTSDDAVGAPTTVPRSSAHHDVRTRGPRRRSGARSSRHPRCTRHARSAGNARRPRHPGPAHARDAPGNPAAHENTPTRNRAELAAPDDPAHAGALAWAQAASPHRAVELPQAGVARVTTVGYGR